MIPGGLEGRSFMPSRLHKGLAPTAKKSSPALLSRRVRGLPLQSAWVTVERRWMAQRQAEGGEMVTGEALDGRRG